MTRKRPWRAAGIALAALVAACSNNNNNPLQNYTPPGAPTGLVYQLNLGEQIGADSIIEPGVLLSWVPPNPDNTVQAFVVYADTMSAPDTSGFFEIGLTTSVSYHDAGAPEPQYSVASQDVNGVLSAHSNIVVIDPTDTVQTPSTLTGTPLDSAALLQWSDNAITGPNASHFDFYRVYSDSVSGGNCVANTTVLEGQTVSNGFVITGVANDVPRCYFVTAVTKSGHESANSPGAIITPTATDPPYSAARISGQYAVIAHHPIALYRSVLKAKHK